MRDAFDRLFTLFGGRRHGVLVTDPAGRQTVLPFTGNPDDVVGGGGTWVVGGSAAAWPVGSVFIAVVPTNPAVLLGVGTWELFAQGRVLVGIAAGDPDFGTVLQEVGEKKHLLTCDEMPINCP